MSSRGMSLQIRRKMPALERVGWMSALLFTGIKLRLDGNC
jgi:hypothetical protein